MRFPAVAARPGRKVHRAEQNTYRLSMYNIALGVSLDRSLRRRLVPRGSKLALGAAKGRRKWAESGPIWFASGGTGVVAKATFRCERENRASPPKAGASCSSVDHLPLTRETFASQTHVRFPLTNVMVYTAMMPILSLGGRNDALVENRRRAD
jgi:hypothetical protein